MGPMPVVAALYDAGPLPADAAQLRVWFTEEMANALAANAAGSDAGRIDFDYRSWAIEGDVEDIRYRVGEHPAANRAQIMTHFQPSGRDGSMEVTWDMCRRDDGQWRITGVSALEVDAPHGDAPEPSLLRPMIGLEPTPPETCA